MTLEPLALITPMVMVSEGNFTCERCPQGYSGDGIHCTSTLSFSLIKTKNEVNVVLKILTSVTPILVFMEYRVVIPKASSYVAHVLIIIMEMELFVSVYFVHLFLVILW